MHLSDDERRRFQQIVSEIPTADRPPLSGAFDQATEAARRRLAVLAVLFVAVLVLAGVGGTPWLAAAAVLGTVSLTAVLAVDRWRRRA